MEDEEFDQLEELINQGKKREVIALIQSDPDYLENIYSVFILMTQYEQGTRDFLELLPTFTALYKNYVVTNNDDLDQKIVDGYYMIMAGMAIANSKFAELQPLATEYMEKGNTPEILSLFEQGQAIIKKKRIYRLINIIMWTGVAMVASTVVIDIENEEIIKPLGYGLGGFGILMTYLEKNRS